MRRLLLISFIVLSLQACTQIDDYMFGKDNTPSPEPLAPINSKAKLSEDWSVSTGKSSSASTYLKLKPVIKGSVVYTANANGVVQAINKDTGNLIWSTPLQERVVSGPAVAEGLVAVNTSQSQTIVLKQTDGSIVWTFKMSGDGLAKPLILSQLIILKTIDGNLYAFDLKTGKRRWKYQHGAPSLILKASSSPVKLGSLVLVGFSDGKLDAVELETGHLVSQRGIAYATGSSDVERLVDIDADPIVRNTTVYLASYQGYVGALQIENGQFLWNKPVSVYKNMAIDANNVYLVDSDDVLWAIGRQDGNVKWKQPALKARGLTEPVLIGNRLVVGDRTGLLHLIATANGGLIARHQLSSPIDIAPAVSGSKVYVMTTNGKLNRFSVVK